MKFNSMNKIKDFFKTIELVYWVIASSFVLLILLGSYLNWAGNKKLALLDEKINIITSSIKLLEENSISTTAELKKSITQTHIDLSSALDNEKRKYKPGKHYFKAIQRMKNAITHVKIE